MGRFYHEIHFALGPMTKDPEILAVVRNDEWWALAKEKERECVGGWVEVVEENGQTVYAHLETEQVSMTRPPEWVKEMIKYYHHPISEEG